MVSPDPAFRGIRLASIDCVCEMASRTIVFQVFIPAKLAFKERLQNLSSFFVYTQLNRLR
jgi:hypothetical protein